MKKNKRIKTEWRLAIKSMFLVIIIILIKLIVHYFNLEFLDLNSLFTAIISANVFLIGFLLTGTLSDYKESERLPSEISSSIETMTDEGLILVKNNKTEIARDYLLQLKKLNIDIINWFKYKLKTQELLNRIRSLNSHFLKFENEIQANFIVRLKQEQNFIRRHIKRIDTIRETSFVKSGYIIVEILTTLLIIGFIFLDLNPYYESIFFIGFVSFMLIYMLSFIRDLDNPFNYRNLEDEFDEIALTHLHQTNQELEELIKSLS